MFDINIIFSLVSPLIVIGCWVLGYVLKHAIKTDVINPFIPLIVMVVGIVCNIWTTGLFVYETVVSGAVSGLAATGLHEAFSNLLNLPKDKEEEKDNIPEGAQHLKS